MRGCCWGGLGEGVEETGWAARDDGRGCGRWSSGYREAEGSRGGLCGKVAVR